jgi:hypothetical protein
MFIKKGKIFFIIVLCCIIIIVSCSIISYITFGTANPIMAGIGLAKVMLLNIDYVVIRKSPQIIIANPKNAIFNLIEYMNTQSFIIEDQMGAMLIFKNNANDKQMVLFRINKYCSIWAWK